MVSRSLKKKKKQIEREEKYAGQKWLGHRLILPKHEATNEFTNECYELLKNYAIVCFFVCLFFS